jgi:YHS domain-containing protein
LSKKSSKYKPNEPTTKFKTLYKHKNPLGTLYYFCKEDNPEEFEKVHNKQVYTDIFGVDKFKTVQINQNYLIKDKDDKFIISGSYDKTIKCWNLETK